MSDDELERLKRKKMQELQRRMAAKDAQQAAQELSKKDKPKEPTKDEYLDRIFGDRAWEVWKIAREQFPQIIPQVEDALVDAVKTGKIVEKIDGGGLAMFLRQMGIPLRLNTQIRFSEHGELKTLQQKIKQNE